MCVKYPSLAWLGFIGSPKVDWLTALSDFAMSRYLKRLIQMILRNIRSESILVGTRPLF